VAGILRPASQAVEISLPKELSDAEYKSRYDQPEDYSWCGPETLRRGAGSEKINSAARPRVSEAAPTNFKITLMPVSVSGFKLIWTDRASDEEGSFIEIKPEGESDFHVCALVEPNVNKFGWALEHPHARELSACVRTILEGPPSSFISPPDREA